MIGTPISAGLGAGLLGGANVGTNIVNAVVNGVAQGVTSLVLEKAVQDLDPLLGALVNRTVSGAFAGLVGPNHNVIDGILSGYKDSALNIVRLGNFGDDSWSQAQYLSRVTGFSDAIQQKGLVQAIEDYATGILHEDSVSSILRSFQTVGAYIQDQINNNKIQTVQINGVNYKKATLPNGDYLLLNEQGTDLVEVRTGGHVLRGIFGKGPDGQPGLIYGTDTWSDATGREIVLTIAEDDDLTISTSDSQQRFTLKFKTPNDIQANKPYALIAEAINRDSSYSGPKISVLRGIGDNAVEWDSAGNLINGSIVQDEAYALVQNGRVVDATTVLDSQVLSAKPWIQSTWNNWSNLVTTDPTLQSIGGYGVGLTEAVLTAPQSFVEFWSNPISSILAIPAALHQAYQTITTGNPYESGQAIGNILGGIEVGLATGGAIRSKPVTGFIQGNIGNIRPYLPRNMLADERGFVRIAAGRSVYGDKVFVIGESVDARVIPFAKKIGASWYRPWKIMGPHTAETEALALARNQKIICQ